MLISGFVFLLFAFGHAFVHLISPKYAGKLLISHGMRKSMNSMQMKKYDIGGRVPKSSKTETIIAIPEPTIAVAEVEEDEEAGLPDKQKFLDFYRKTVKAGKEMRMDQFMRYEEVATLLDEEFVYPDDINDLWVSAVGDASGLDENEAYEMLCMVTDLPEPEDEDFLDKEFKQLAGDKSGVNYVAFLNWEDVQAILKEEALSMEQLTAIWRNVAGDLNAAIDRKQFSRLNNALDAALDEDSEGEEEEEEEEAIDLTGVDIWDPAFDAKDVFDDESLEEITAFYKRAAGLKGLSYEDIVGWSDIGDMVEEGLVTAEDLKGLWREAARGKSAIDLDTFIRFNVKLDLLVEEAEGAEDSEGDEEDAEGFYRSEFKRLTAGGRLLRLDMLQAWEDVAELIKEGVLSPKQVATIFDSLPQEPMGIPANTFGINEDTFVAFNGMLDLLMDASGAGETGVAATPASLVSSAARPMPSEKELKIGSLGSAEDDSTTGLSQSELDLMETLDKADNMLNSGSFTDFDQLIGDMNDPRLAALRTKDLDATNVQGSLKEILRELSELAREQKRCGLDKPSEETAARLRDLIQAVIEQAPRAATRDIGALTQAVNGKWKLLYSNSEMFDFYNGITGFVNVFPASKFVSLSTEYASDGFLAEAKFYETLSTPLGPVQATVFATWELLKEMSFMTNDNSVVLRSYCSKVTAGPMEYLAEENWKSLRTMSMNELVYVDDKIRIMRNCGALRIFFVYERE